MTPTPDQRAPVRDQSRYVAHVWDLLCLTPSLESQRVYRVGAVRMGCLGEESVVEMESLGFNDVHPIGVPLLLLEAAVDSGYLRHVWREPRSEPAEIVRRGTAAMGWPSPPSAEDLSKFNAQIDQGKTRPMTRVDFGEVPTAAPGAGDEAADPSVAALALILLKDHAPDYAGAPTAEDWRMSPFPIRAKAILAAIRAGKVPGIITEDKASELTTRLTAEAIACQEMLGREIATLKTDLEATTSAYATRLKAYNEMKIERDTLKAEVEKWKSHWTDQAAAAVEASNQRDAAVRDRDAAINIMVAGGIAMETAVIAEAMKQRDAAIARAEQLAKELAYTRALGTTSVDQTASEMELQRTRADAAERRVVELVGLLRWWASEYGAHSNHPSAIATRAALAAAPPPDIAVGRAPFVQLLLDLRETLKGTEDKRAIARAMIESALAAAPTTDGGASGVGR